MGKELSVKDCEYVVHVGVTETDKDGYNTCVLESNIDEDGVVIILATTLANLIGISTEDLFRYMLEGTGKDAGLVSKELKKNTTKSLTEDDADEIVKKLLGMLN